VRLLIITITALALSACSSHSIRTQPEEEGASAAGGIGQRILHPLRRPPPSTGKPGDGEQAEYLAGSPAYADLWIRIAENLRIERPAGQRILEERLAWYGRNQQFLDRVAERARPYLYHIVEELQSREMPLDLALLPIVESAYHPFALSPMRASGIWQFIPGTGKRYGLKQNSWYDGRRDIIAATRAALDYLEALHRQFDGDWLLAMAAYNAGERNVARAIERNRNAGRDTDFWSVSQYLPRETRAYVPSILAVAELVSGPERFDVQLAPVPNEPYFAAVSLDGQIDLARAASLADMSLAELRTLNPGFTQWATDPDGPHRLLLPLDRLDRFSQGLSELPAEERVTWTRHQIRQGETLGAIAARYRTSVDVLQRANNLNGHLIRAGGSLLIPGGDLPVQAMAAGGAGDSRTHEVRTGDTLWIIGRRYGVSIGDLCAWNGISAESVLRPGQTLLVRSDGGRTQRPIAEDDALRQVAARGERSTSAVRYTVRHGDSLWRISKRFGVSVNQLRTWNRLSARSLLQPGQVLVVHLPGRDTTGA
jgi:membrane-bound lytic murein transglycosylase D